jgi:broad specificity phosphatase PhoE
MTILLVRHAESAGNFDERVYETTSDQAIHLTDKGHEQAAALGHFLKEWYAANPPKADIRLWCSPYKRTMLTLRDMRKTLGEWVWNKCGRGNDIHFDERLREREWGMYQASAYQPGKEIETEHPRLYAYYRKIRDAELGRLLARPYGGESIADVIDRMRSLFHDVHFDIQHGVTDHMFIMHGVAIKAFVTGFTKTHPAFLDAEPLLGNTGVQLLDIDPVTKRYADYGAIYDPSRKIRVLEKPTDPIKRDLSTILDLI